MGGLFICLRMTFAFGANEYQLQTLVYIWIFSEVFDWNPSQHRAFRLSNGSTTLEVHMKGDAKVIEFLNETLKNELTAINQYFLHFRMLEHWGVAKLAKCEYEESIDEMKHADRLAERILFLDGLPNFQMLGRLRIGETVEEVLKADLALENDAIPQLKEAIAYCEQVRDFGTRDLLQSILESEEEHVDMLEKQFEMIERMGIQNYIQLQSKPAHE